MDNQVQWIERNVGFLNKFSSVQSDVFRNMQCPSFFREADEELKPTLVRPKGNVEIKI